MRATTIASRLMIALLCASNALAAPGSYSGNVEYESSGGIGRGGILIAVPLLVLLLVYVPMVCYTGFVFGFFMLISDRTELQVMGGVVLVLSYLGHRREQAEYKRWRANQELSEKANQERDEEIERRYKISCRLRNKPPD